MEFITSHYWTFWNNFWLNIWHVLYTTMRCNGWIKNVEKFVLVKMMFHHFVLFLWYRGVERIKKRKTSQTEDWRSLMLLFCCEKFFSFFFLRNIFHQCKFSFFQSPLQFPQLKDFFCKSCWCRHSFWRLFAIKSGVQRQ